MQEKQLTICGMAVSLVPLLLVLFFLSFPIRARLVLGEWPTYNNPDPSELGFSVHYLLANISAVYIVPSFLFCLISILLVWRAGGRLIPGLTSFVVTAAVTILVCRYSLRPLFEWFID